MWDAAYNANHTVGYIQTNNGSLYSLSVNKNAATAQQVGQQLTALTSAPTVNSSLVVDKTDRLLAVWGSSCGNSPIQVSAYDNGEWKQIAKSSANWYQDEAAVWYDSTDNTIYIYGGACNNQVANTFYKYNLTADAFGTLHPSLMPLEMSSARAIPINAEQTVVIGGHASNAWMSMEQVAVWAHGSWTFQAVSGFGGIDSRDSPLLLPLWESGLGDTVTGILALGGSVNGRPSRPSAVVLNTTAAWSWQNASIDSIDYLDATLYETLVSMDANNGQVSLFNGLQNFAPTHAVGVPAQATTATTAPGTSHSRGVSKAVIAVMSTIFPLIFIAAVGLGGWWWWRKRIQRRTFKQPIQQMGHLRRISSPAPVLTNERPISGGEFPPVPEHLHHHGDGDSFVNMDRSDIRFLVQQNRQELRVVNPDSVDLISLGSTHSRQTTSTLGDNGMAEDPFKDPVVHEPLEAEEDFDFGPAPTSRIQNDRVKRGHSRTTSVNAPSGHSRNSSLSERAERHAARRRVTP